MKLYFFDFQYNKNIQLVVMNRVLLLTERLAQREPPFFFFLLLKENEEEKVTAKTKVSKSNWFSKDILLYLNRILYVCLGQKMSIKLTNTKYYNLDPVFDILPRTYIISALIQSRFFFFCLMEDCLCNLYYIHFFPGL